MPKKKRKNWITPASDFDSFTKRVDDSKFYLLESPFYQEVLSTLKKSLEIADIDNVEQCICYGLGNISLSVISRYQLALLLLLRDHFKWHVEIFDPVFLPIELEYLAKFDLHIIDHNEEGLRTISSPTLMYMPHCPNALLNNLLHSNWLPSLANCIIFGNSFTLLSDTLTEHNMETKFRCIRSMIPFASEFPIKNDFKYPDVFNDLSLHIFRPNPLKELPPAFWKDNEKPVYDDYDMECISTKLSNFNLKS